ncbi:MAG: DNA-binding GntR family transcriptional regulator [Dinoroseobacter sp.]|jgi:DNA-binding GntR family transcriptional regulator
MTRNWTESYLGVYREPEGSVRDSLSDHAEAHLKWRVLNGAFVSGEKIREAALAKELDISRATIREATRRLAGAGLVEIDAQRGVFVRTYTLEQIEDISEIRRALCSLTASSFVSRATPTDRARITDMFDRLEAADGRAYEPADYLLGLLFNEAVVRAANNERLFTLYHEAWQQMRIFKLFLRRHVFGAVDVQAHNHSMFSQGAVHRRTLYQAVLSGNEADIADAMRRSADHSLLRAQEQFADYLAATQSTWREKIVSTRTPSGNPAGG